MALTENITDSKVIENLITQISSLTLFIQAIGGLIILYIIFNIISIIMNRKKERQLDEISKNLKDIKNNLKKK